MIVDFSRQVGATFANRAKAKPFSEIKKLLTFSEDIVVLMNAYRGSEVDRVDNRL